MKFEFLWPDGRTQVLEGEEAFLKLSSFKGENIARMIMDEVRWKGGTFAFDGSKPNQISRIKFKPVP